jgi:hypothetical protein
VTVVLFHCSLIRLASLPGANMPFLGGNAVNVQSSLPLILHWCKEIGDLGWKDSSFNVASGHILLMQLKVV